MKLQTNKLTHQNLLNYMNKFIYLISNQTLSISFQNFMILKSLSYIKDF
mgnify:CR=1 FL=1